ncbi:MAG: glutaredoxin 3 [Rhodospirillaceae bacterium]|jgi:glutaredoxin 3|nr:glutaredoxin 3 [Rhodospirillaceae bacterium]
MQDVTIYTTGFCPFCYHAKKLLDSKGVAYDEIDVGAVPGARKEMMQRAQGSHTVPQIFIGDHHIGGCDELYALDQQQKLDPLLAQDAAS